MRCLNCGTELAIGARFCMYCGQPIEARTADDDTRHAHLAASVPAQLAEKMRAARLSGERKVVTILFADVVGSTAMAERMDAEDWTAMMNGAFDRISPIIYRYEGTIARLLGDAMLAFFGAPVAHEDDPERGARAALEILDEIRDYARQAQTLYGVEFTMRAGLNTGPVVVGEVGSDLKYEYTAMGDAVNLAARMQSTAQPMTALSSENTYRFIAPLFDFLDLGLIEVKGKAEPVRVYQVLSMRTRPGKQRGLAGLNSPMVGRDPELATLVKLSQSVNEGFGSIAVVAGEPGLGKTRLISEWKATALGQSSSLRWAEGRCLSYGGRLAYHLLVDMVRSLIGIQTAQSPAEAHDFLRHLAQDLFGSIALEAYPYIAHLLSLPLGGEDLERVQALDPQTLQIRYLVILQRLLRGITNRQPLVIVLEDIHWADPSSVELITKLLPLVKDSAVMFCLVARPERDTVGWSLVSSARQSLDERLTEINLVPLSENDSRQLVLNLLEIDELPDQTRNIILRKAEGNPFFVEEVIRMLIERGAIVKKDDRWAAGEEITQVEIPDNLQGLLLARIDRLPEDARRVLRVASVIGRQFSLQVLARVLEAEKTEG